MTECTSCYRCATEEQERREAVEGLSAEVMMITSGRMFCCPMCGNKRCPHATDHRNVCTRLNDSGQAGSRYS